MGGTGEWLEELARELEHRLLEGVRGERGLAAAVVSVVAARVVGEAAAQHRPALRAKVVEGWRRTLAEYGAAGTTEADWPSPGWSWPDYTAGLRDGLDARPAAPDGSRFYGMGHTMGVLERKRRAKQGPAHG